MSVAAVQKEASLQVRWVPFPLHPETPEEGQDLADLFAGRGIDVDAVLRRLQAVAREVGVPLGGRRRTYNSRRAQELGEWAEAQGKGEAFRNAVFRAYFAEGKNIALPEELERVAESVGLAPQEAGRVLREKLFAGVVDGRWEFARRMGVTAVPTHLFRGRTSAGYLPPGDLLQFVSSGKR